jgi:flagella basal body P-ring formation protein FlgA
MTRLKYSIIVFTCLICFILLPAGTTAAKRGTKQTTSNYQTLPEAKFEKIFRAYVRKQLERRGSDFSVSKVKVMGNGPVPAGKATFQLFQKDQRNLGGQVGLTALVRVDGVEARKVRISGWVDVFDSVVCVSRNVKRGEILQDDDLYLSRKNITRLPLTTLTEKGQAIGLMVKHQIRAETPLKEWMLVRAPIVKRGDMVTILAEAGGLRVSVPGKILEKGYKGQLVRVQNTMSHKKIYAKVINDATVRVDF